MAKPKQPDQKRQDAEKRGREGEEQAAHFLRAQGYTIEAMRYRASGGEVDIIARKEDDIIFVEVKVRRTIGKALDAISITAQRRIESAAESWIAEQEEGGRLSWRFDVIALCPGHLPQHFENVW